LLSGPMHMRVPDWLCQEVRGRWSEGMRGRGDGVYGQDVLAWRSHSEVVVQDDVPEWIDKGFVINEKQVAYESKNLKKRKICVSRKRWNTKGKRARERERWRWSVLTSSSTAELLTLMYPGSCVLGQVALSAVQLFSCLLTSVDVSLKIVLV